jgi:hypothetical protein
MKRLCQRGWLALAVATCALTSIWAQPSPSEIALSDGYRINSVKVAGRWVGSIPLPLAAGDAYNPAKVSEAIGVIKTRFASAEADAALFGRGLTSITFITSKVTANHSARTVDITLLPYAVRLAVDEQGRNFLPLPRSPFATDFTAVPAWLRTLNPQATLRYDARMGLAPTAQVAVAGSTIRKGDWFASAAGEHSLSKDFFDAQANGGYRREFRNGLLQQATMLAGFSSQQQPSGMDTITSTAGWADTQLALRLSGAGRTTRFVVGGRLQDGDEKSTGMSSARDRRVALRALGETRVAAGNARLAVWLEHGKSDRAGAGEYQRLAGLLGYVKEIPLGAHRSIGFEFIAGGGTIRGTAPAGARFSGGAQTGSFLFDGLGSGGFAELPRGPLLRNFGRGEAGVRDALGRVQGGKSFWSGSLTLSFPVKAWSFPLLPTEPVTEIEQPDGSVRSLTLGDLLQRQVKSGQGMFAGILEAKGTPPDAAAREAEEVFGGLQPAIVWLAEQANLVGLKPVLMCDAAQIRGTQGRRESWLGIGGGLQLVIVTAKLEAGYMATVHGPRLGRPGSFSARLVFQNLF